MNVHVKRLLIGTIAAAIVLTAVLGLIWLLAHYGKQVGFTILALCMLGACYGLGMSLTTKRVPVEPERRPSGGGFAE